MATTISSAHVHATPPPRVYAQTNVRPERVLSAITNIRERFHLLAILMFGVGIFALLGCNDMVFADYAGIPFIVDLADSISDTDATALDRTPAVAFAQINGRHYVLTTSMLEDGVQILDVTNPSDITAVSVIRDGQNGFTELNSAFDITIHQIGSNHYALVTANADDGVQIIDITNPASPTAVSAVTDGQNGFTELDGVRGIDTVQIGNHHYALVVAQDDNGFVLMNFSNPSTPTGVSVADEDDTTGNFKLLQGAFDVVIQQIGNSYLGYITGSGGVQIVDITNPSSIQPVRTINGIGGGHDITITQIGSSYYLLLTIPNDNSILIYDVTDTTNIHRESKIVDGATFNINALHSMGIYMTGDDTMFNIDAPQGIDTFQLGDGHYAVVASSGGDEVQFIDITHPSNPVPVGHFADGQKGFNLLNGAMGVSVTKIGGNHYVAVSATTDDTISLMKVQEHTRVHTHMVEYERLVFATTESGSHGVRNSNILYVDVTPPFHFSSSSVYVKIRDTGSATYGEDYSLSMPNKANSTDTKVLQLPAGESRVGFGITFNNDYIDEAAESAYLALEAIERAPYTLGGNWLLDIVILNGATITPDADPNRGIYIRPSNATVTTGETQNYTIALNTIPTSNVMVRPYLDSYKGEIDIGNTPRSYTGIKVTPESLTFTSTNWYVPQTFTIHPGDSEPGRYIIIHGVSSADPNYRSANIFQDAENTGYFGGPGVIGRTHFVATVASNDTMVNAEPIGHDELGVFQFPTSVTLSLSPASIHEGNGTTTITATLDAPAPPDGIDISLYASDGNATDGVDYTLPNVITIIPGEQSGSAPIAITNDSLDESNESVTISAYVEVFGQSMTDYITLAIIDDDTSGVTITTDTTPLSVDEGDTTTYTIHLDSLPTANVTIHATSSDDGAVSISPESHTFTPSNWDTSKTFTVAGVSDPDTNYELVHIRHSISSNDTMYTAILLPFVEVRVSDTTQEQGQKEEQEVQEEQEQIPPPETETESESESEPELETKQPEQPQLDPIVVHYDTNNSGAIEQDEWVKAKEDYANGKLTNAEIHAISKARA